LEGKWLVNGNAEIAAPGTTSTFTPAPIRTARATGNQAGTGNAAGVIPGMTTINPNVPAAVGENNFGGKMGNHWQCPYCKNWYDSWVTKCEDPECKTNKKSGRYWKCSWCHHYNDDNLIKCEKCGRDTK
jgi:hypothetical protein